MSACGERQIGDRVNLGDAEGTVEDVSLRVRRGEVVGVFGLVGAGRTELLEAIYGLHPGRTTGTVAVDGKTTLIRRPADAIAAGLALAPEDRKREGLFPEMSVLENTSLASLGAAVKGGLIRPARESARRSAPERRSRKKRERTPPYRPSGRQALRATTVIANEGRTLRRPSRSTGQCGSQPRPR